jgi:hypothetical protein
VAVAQDTWPSQYKIAPWDSARLTPADVVGPDGLVYPDWTGVGVEGGVPDINAAGVRASYVVFNVVNYGAAGDGVAVDDAPVAAALAAALDHVAASPSHRAILHFPAGTYRLTQSLRINRPRVVIDGDGPAATLLRLEPGGSAGNALFDFAPATVTNWSYLYATATLARGSSTGVFDKNPFEHGYAVGMWVRLVASAAPEGSTMRTRYSKPAMRVDYTDPYWHFGRPFIAKVTAIDEEARTVTFDRTFPHDYYPDELPQTRPIFTMEGNGVQDLQIATTAATVTLAPVRFSYTANGWMLNTHIAKAANWPLLQETIARMEIRDCVFDGTWADPNSGSNSYLGWISAVDSIMDNCRANGLRHMAIFQHAVRCVVRNCTFTGVTIQSPQLHGRFPLENLVEGTVFNHTTPAGTTRGLTAYGSDWAHSVRHGPNGPRNVFYRNQVLAGAATFVLGGASEGFIFAYNRVLLTDEIERLPFIWAADRTFDTIVRGNRVQSVNSMPALNLEDPTCTGWEVYDNVLHGTQGFLWAGDSDPEIVANNRRQPAGTPPADPAPEAVSIYAWQKTHAFTPRLLLFTHSRALTDRSGTAELRLVRVHAPVDAALSVTLQADLPGLTHPASVTIPAGESSVRFTVTGEAISGGERTITLTASAPDLLADAETLQLLDLEAAQPTWLNDKLTTVTSSVPPGWKGARFGRSTTDGSLVRNASTGVWTLSGSGLETFSYDATLARSGRYFAYQTIHGDGEIRARITSATGHRQVGLLILDDAAPITEHMLVTAAGQVMTSGYNNLSHARPNEFVAPGATTFPVWLRLQRQGSVFSAYRSSRANPVTEADWTLLARVDFYQDGSGTNWDYKSRATLDPVMHYGLFINSGSETAPATAHFTDVTLTPALSDYLSWALAAGLAPESSGATDADPDGDGFTNLLEYALATDPLRSGPGLPVQIAPSEARLALTFLRARGELTYEVEGSSDLATWTVIATDPGSVGQNATVHDTVDLLAHPRRFLRLRVSGTP